MKAVIYYLTLKKEERGFFFSINGEKK